VTFVVPEQIDMLRKRSHVCVFAMQCKRKDKNSVSRDMEGVNGINSAQAANSTSGVYRREGKDSYCAPEEKNRQRKGRTQCHLRPAGYIFVI
jgi:hypothetical protein